MNIKAFQSELKKRNVDFALFYNVDYDKTNANMFYFSGYKGIGALIITKNKRFLIIPKMEIGRVKGIKAYIWDKDHRLFEFVKKKVKGKVIGIDKNVFTLNAYKEFKKQFKNVKTVDISSICNKLRAIKTNEEIGIIKEACKITDNILKKCFSNFKKFRKETDVAAFLENETKKSGYELAFNPVVASGKNAAVPHHAPENIKLKKGFCVIDFGIKYKGYCSDATRTIYIGRPKEKEIRLYNFLLRMQKDAIKNAKIGKKCSDLYNKVNEDLKEYKKYFTHGLGHGIGIDVHELPNLTEKSKDILKRGMAFTIEPGIYFKNQLGIRIEDDILLTKKAEILTKTKKGLMVI
ncbi:aminopeptidase P family protein [Candidatus Woesearchaeota archaeon]|nr:aminopeptidase P family protein [Candidatus Woesearchaeota archaeon]